MQEIVLSNPNKDNTERDFQQYVHYTTQYYVRTHIPQTLGTAMVAKIGIGGTVFRQYLLRYITNKKEARPEGDNYYRLTYME